MNDFYHPVLCRLFFLLLFFTMTNITTQQLANELVRITRNLPLNKRYILGIAGVPGSGKTWLSQYLVSTVNQEFNKKVAVALSMDGFHLTKEQLRAMPVNKIK
jgi:pantothenate kinase